MYGGIGYLGGNELSVKRKFKRLHQKKHPPLSCSEQRKIDELRDELHGMGIIDDPTQLPGIRLYGRELMWKYPVWSLRGVTRGDDAST